MFLCNLLCEKRPFCDPLILLYFCDRRTILYNYFPYITGPLLLLQTKPTDWEGQENETSNVETKPRWLVSYLKKYVSMKI